MAIQVSCLTMMSTFLQEFTACPPRPPPPANFVPNTIETRLPWVVHARAQRWDGRALRSAPDSLTPFPS